MLNRTVIFLLIHVIILASLFTFRFLGVTAEVVLSIALAVISMEAICMAVFTKDATGRALRDIKEMQTDVAAFKETASETVKLQRALLYAGHQIKTIQGDLDLLKRRAEFKSQGNGQHRRIHTPMISSS